MESIAGKVAIVGMGCTKFGELWDKSFYDLIIDACYEAFEDAGLESKDIQAAWYGSRETGYTGTWLAGALKLEYIPVTRVENFCAGGQDVLRNACYGVASGVYDIALACGVEKCKDHNIGMSFLITNPFDRSMTEWALPPASQFGQYAIPYFRHYGLSDEEGRRILAKIAVKNHHNGTLNPKAHFQREITVEDVLNAPIISWPLGLYDACGVSDGCAAAIVTTPEIAKSLRKDYMLVKAQQIAVGGNQLKLQSGRDFYHIQENEEAAKKAYQEAGITNPRKEIDLAEVHDCFTITELLIYEGLGFSAPGKGPEDVEAGTFTLAGELPVNPDGGLKCFGHPISASGLRMTYEIYKQLQDKAGPRQVKNARIGLTHSLGGNLGQHICAISIFSMPD